MTTYFKKMQVPYLILLLRILLMARLYCPKIILNKINFIIENKFKTIPDILHYNQDIIISTPLNLSHIFLKRTSATKITIQNSLHTEISTIRFRNSVNECYAHYNLCYYISELTLILQSCSCKSPRPDNISYIFLKNLPVLGTQTLFII